MSKRYPEYPPYDREVRCEEVTIAFPAQHQPRQPGMEYEMVPRPIFLNPAYRTSGRLQGRVALITGGDSGIGRAVAIAFALEGADVALSYLDEERDARETAGYIEEIGREVLLLPGDIRDSGHCRALVQETVGTFGHLNILVNNAGVQYPQSSILDISEEQLEHTYRTNIFPHFYLTKAALPHLSEGDSIIGTASITAYEGTPLLVDYSSTKGAIVSFTRSLSRQLARHGIRVNAVAPGPTWTPLIVSSYSAEYVQTFGNETEMGRAGQPFELAPAYVYLASDDSRFVTGQVLHVNGGEFRTT